MTLSGPNTSLPPAYHQVGGGGDPWGQRFPHTPPPPLREDPPSEDKVEASVLDATLASRCPLPQLGNLFISERVHRGSSSPSPRHSLRKQLLRSSRDSPQEMQRLKDNSPCSQKGLGEGMRRGDTVCVTVPDSGVRQALIGRDRVGRKFCGSKDTH